ncbi:cyclic nucleotide-binding-like protein [Sporodiniella umbellata]|nr:cyclic nucleotide-binding-like protein [Sporodiniella umbellata]
MIVEEQPFQFAAYADEYTQLLTELHELYCAEKPLDVLQFCSNFFTSKLEEQRRTFRNNNTQYSSQDNNDDVHPLFEKEQDVFGNDSKNGFEWNDKENGMDISYDDFEDEEHDDFPVEPLSSAPSAIYNRIRRTSVSAESMAPTEDFVKVVIPKTESQAERIKRSIGNNFLFRDLDEEQYIDIVNAMSEKHLGAGAMVIEQGAVGDYFYVVECGTLDCFIYGNKVTSYEAGGSFGELALMYNAPRAATITTSSECVLWALDRITFRTILMENTSHKRRMYESFLSEVALLKSLEPYERHKIADALESIYFEDGEQVVKQGDVGEQFYIIESGKAIVLKTNVSYGTTNQVNILERGSYFGELALLNDSPRAATVVAHGRLKCATLSKKAFTRLLGPVLDILKRNSENYHAIINQQ